ncbi:MAG TPA: peptidoglycan-binding protein [Solirubrobacterales bacterium]
MADVGWRRPALAVAAIAVVAAVGALALAGGSGGASGSEPPAKATGTGTVERRTLAERLTATGTIGYAGEATVLARLSGTVTALPAVGGVVRRGERLYALAGEPVLLMYGAVPAYRALAEGVSEGKDVEELERNLVALGYEPGTVDDDFTDTTAAAVSAWQEDLGDEASGEVELGRVAFLRGPQRVTGLEATLGEALGGGGGGGEEAESEPASVPVFRTSSTRRIVSVDLEADRQSVAHRGQKVEVILPGGAEVPGEVRRLAAFEALSGEGEGGEEAEAGVEATIAVTGGHRIPALDGASVNVLFTQQVRKHVLSVPLTALIAIGGERFAVDALGPDSAGRQIVVTPGLAADGYVEVEGKGLRAGMAVETGR